MIERYKQPRINKLLDYKLSFQIPAPFKPEVKNETDVSNFDTDFTTEKPELTPPDEGM